MDDNELFTFRNIIRDMSEGVLVINLKGRITEINPAASTILGLSQEVKGKSLIEVFFGTNDENDDFVQEILNAIYEDDVVHNSSINYHHQGEEKKLFLNTSFMKAEDQKIGVVAVINDVTELMELRDAMTAMEKIKQLNVALKQRNEFIKKTFGRYLTDEIVESLLDKKDGLKLGGEKRVVTMMFTDLRGFTNISEDMDPVHLLLMLNHYLEEMISIITEYKGTILEFIGDAIVVVFGAPVQHDKDVTHAVYCAVKMQKRMEDINLWNQEHHYPILAMGIGIHTGETVLGNIGSLQKTKYDILGSNVNLASRIESYTVGGQILISREVKDKCEAQLKIAHSWSVRPKGVKQPVMIYDIYGVDEYCMDNEVEIFNDVEHRFVEVFLCDNKHIKPQGIQMRVLKMSLNEMILDTDIDIERGSTVMIKENNQEVQAKVVDVDKSQICVHYTLGKIINRDQKG